MTQSRGNFFFNTRDASILTTTRSEMQNNVRVTLTLFAPHHSSCTVTEQLFASFHPAAQGTGGRGEMDVCSQLSRSVPRLFPSSHSGTPAWGMLDYAVHTFACK